MSALLNLPAVDELQLLSQYILRPEAPAYLCSSQAIDKPGIYALFNGQDDLLYVGRSSGVSRRIRQYFYERRLGRDKTEWDCFTVSYAPEPLIAKLEAAHIAALQPPLNKRIEPCYVQCFDTLVEKIRDAWSGAIRSQHG